MKTVTSKLSIIVVTSIILAALIALFPNVSRCASRYSYPMVPKVQPSQEIFADSCDALMAVLDASARR